MPDLFKQAAQPRVEYIPPKLHGTSIGSYCICPRCGGHKSKPAPVCRACSTTSLRATVDNAIYIVNGEPCRKLALNSGRYTLVNADLYDFLMQWRWKCYGYFNAKREPQFYVVTKTRTKDSRQWNQVKMHHIILGIPSSIEVDHCNRDGLDNRCSNFRICDSWGNTCNRGKRRDNTSGFIGVSKRSTHYSAFLTSRGVRFYRGGFISAEEAARERDRIAIREHGEFAILNFPVTTET